MFGLLVESMPWGADTLTSLDSATQMAVTFASPWHMGIFFTPLLLLSVPCKMATIIQSGSMTTIINLTASLLRVEWTTLCRAQCCYRQEENLSLEIVASPVANKHWSLCLDISMAIPFITLSILHMNIYTQIRGKTDPFVL